MSKRILVLVTALAVAASILPVEARGFRWGGGRLFGVRSYVKPHETYVAPRVRTRPDSILDINLSYRGQGRPYPVPVPYDVEKPRLVTAAIPDATTGSLPTTPTAPVVPRAPVPTRKFCDDGKLVAAFCLLN